MKTTTMIILGGAAVFAYMAFKKKGATSYSPPVNNLNNEEQWAAPSRIPFVRFAAQDPKSLVTQVAENMDTGNKPLFSILFPNL